MVDEVGPDQQQKLIDELRRQNVDLSRIVAEQAAEARRAEGELRKINVHLAGLYLEQRRSRELLRTLFDGLEDGLALIDSQGLLLALNQPMAVLAQKGAETLTGRPWTECCAHSHLQPLARLVAASLDDGMPRRERVRIESGPATRIIDVQTLPQLDEARGTEQLVVRVHDLTEHLQIEAQMVEQERFAANGRLAATVAHEMSTPLQAIENCLHLAGRSDEEQRARYLRLAREEIHRIGTVLHQLLDLYRPDGARIGPVDLNTLVERVLLLTGSSLSRQRIHIERDLALKLPPATGRADELTQVLLNLVVNAANAMPRGGVLRLETRLQDEGAAPMLTISVADNGPGIPPEFHERIFEPFFTTRAEGSGLGLAISRRLVAACGGQLTVASTPGAGSRFTVALPIARAE